MARVSQSRHITHSGRPPTDPDEIQDALHDIRDELVISVQAVHRQLSARHGVYIGDPGILVMDWHIASVLERISDSRTDTSQRSSHDLYSWFPFAKPTFGGKTAFLETDVGAATLILMSDLRAGQLDVKGGTDRSRAAAILLREAIHLAVNGNDPKDDDGCEVLYGRAGLLYALLALRLDTRARRRSERSLQESPDAFSGIVEQLCHDQNIGALVDEIVERGKRGAIYYASDAGSREEEDAPAPAPALMWSWHGKRYLGSAHGVAGILHMLISAPESVLKRHWDAIVQTVRWLVTIQDPETGNWSHKAATGDRALPTRDKPDEMVQWCHGAPGMLMLFSLLLRQRDSRLLELPDSLCTDIHESLARGGQFVYERGLLRKGTGLCHGIAGSVYALLAVSDALDRSSTALPTSTRTTRSQAQSHPHPTEQPSWFLRALHFAHLATSYRRMTQRGEMRNADRPFSLYEGLAGMCCAWADILRRDEDARANGRAERGMPGYDDLCE